MRLVIVGIGIILAISASYLMITSLYSGITDKSDDPGIGGTRDDPGIMPPVPDLSKPKVIADSLDIPWSIGWLPDGTMLYTERNGMLHMGEKAILKLDVAGGEGGLLGLAIDPEYGENNYIYLYNTYDVSFANTMNRVDRYVLDKTGIYMNMTIIDGIPGSFIHDGGRIKFGPDNMLYITTGDAYIQNLAQDADSRAGKILRMDRDGNIPADNPIPGSRVYSLGHRNPQGLDWDIDNNLVITEHGPSGIGSDSGRDEINHIIPGGNYGWPRVTGDDHGEWNAPIHHTGSDTWAPSGSTFYYGDKIPGWHGKYLVAGLRGQSLYVLDIDLEENTVTYERWYQEEFGRLRDVQVGPDGYVYVLTSNGGNMDRILRIPGS